MPSNGLKKTAQTMSMSKKKCSIEGSATDMVLGELGEA
jgi:hypothetical protein